MWFHHMQDDITFIGQRNIFAILLLSLRNHSAAKHYHPAALLFMFF